MEGGVRRCSVTVTIPQHQLNVEWAQIVTQVVRHRLLDAWEKAAMKALATFCVQHLVEIVLTPFVLFPPHDGGDQLW
jgi:hypothetical protein